VTYIVGGGNTSAMHPAFMINQIWRSRLVLPPEPELKELVHEIAVATTDGAQLKQIYDELQGLRRDFEEERAERTFSNSPVSSARRRFGPETKEQWYMLIDILINTIGVMLVILGNASQPAPPTIIIQNHEQEIVQQLKEVNEHLEKLEATSAETPAPSPKPKKHR
jgi:hypothetical protein